MTNDVTVLSKEEALEWVGSNAFDVILTLGAGDIDTFVEPIKEMFAND